ncbi:unnamed protein product [Durusdinium trenchii]|uniref:Uncharacterized protein n=1 Tax=Durusdinium trenchii TaxID=1381693 RepID=A0ABP0IEN7_9DINO
MATGNSCNTWRFHKASLSLGTIDDEEAPQCLAAALWCIEKLLAAAIGASNIGRAGGGAWTALCHGPHAVDLQAWAFMSGLPEAFFSNRLEPTPSKAHAQRCAVEEASDIPLPLMVRRS